MVRLPNVLLRFPNRPEHVLVVRQALSGVADALDLDRVRTNDLQTAVTEACNNVVMFAYDGAKGPMEVTVRSLPGQLVATVRDSGTGMAATSAGPGIGLHLIRAVADGVDIGSTPGEGTEVRMIFKLPDSPELGTPAARGARADVLENLAADAVRIELAPEAIVASVLPRAFVAVAASARFSVDRLAAIERLGKSLVELALGADCVSLEVGMSPRALTVALTPCTALASASEVLSATPAGLVLELQNHLERAPADVETLSLSLSQSLA